MALPVDYSVLSLAVRWKSTVLAVIGIGLVIAVFVGLLSMASGFGLALRASGSAGNAIVLEKGALSELGSSFSTAAGDSAADDPRVARGPDGAALASPELVMVVALPAQSGGQLANVGVRGVTPAAFALRGEVTLIEGRRPRAGLHEVMVGRQTASRIQGLKVGSSVSLLRHPFGVVGVFSDGGSAFESEIWGDFAAMGSAFNRSGMESSLTVRLRDPKTLAAFDQDLKASVQYPLTMTDEREYYEGQAGPLMTFLRGLAVFVGVVTGIGAVFAAMNTMYAIVAHRTREVGTLRAIGFSRFSVLMSFMLEGLLLAIAGGLLGCLLSLLMNGMTANTSASLGEVSFAFRVTPSDLAYGLAFAAAMGVIGSLLPAARAARLPIISALGRA
jgi:putative ABC transport system permease protein